MEKPMMFRSKEDAQRVARQFDTFCGSTKVERVAGTVWWAIVRDKPAFTRA